MYERLLEILNAVGRPKVLLVGDFMLDRYLYGHTDRISPEAPVIVMNVTERRQGPGGAGSVAVDLAMLGAQVRCFGIIGDDDTGRQLAALLADLEGVGTSGLVVDPSRPTTVKERVIGLAQHRHQQQLMRIDEESTQPVSAEAHRALMDHIRKALDECDVVCLEDYNKGLLTTSFCQELISAAKAKGKKVIIDPAATSDYHRYAGAWMIKPNRREVTLAAGFPANGLEGVAKSCERIAQQYAVENVVVTLDKQGAYLYQAASNTGDLIPTRPRDVYDVTGAGDMVLATLGLLVGGTYADVKPPTLEEIVKLANIAGGLEVEHYGSVGIPREDIIAELMREGRAQGGKLRSLPVLLQELAFHGRQGKRIVFTNGCFDILHSGHVDLLRRAAQEGDILIVGINSDESVRGLKGPERPINRQEDRAVVLGALEAVDYVVIFDEPTPLKLIEAISPNVLVKGSDWTGNVVGAEWVEQHDGRVVLIPLTEGFSTSGIIEKVTNGKDKP